MRRTRALQEAQIYARRKERMRNEHFRSFPITLWLKKMRMQHPQRLESDSRILHHLDLPPEDPDRQSEGIGARIEAVHRCDPHRMFPPLSLDYRMTVFSEKFTSHPVKGYPYHRVEQCKPERSPKYQSHETLEAVKIRSHPGGLV